MAKNNNALVLTGLTKAYGNTQALCRLNLTIKSGEFFTLLGPSGSGKTTTLMLIAGFAEPDSGKIVLNGHALIGTPPAKRNIGVVFQNYALFPHLDVSQNLAFPLNVRGMRLSDVQRRVTDALALVGLSGSGHKLPGELSGGQQQRVALARALIFEPDMLLMDEPLGALDRRLRLQLQFELRRLQRELGVTVVYVTHDQEEALSMSDRIAVMADGRLQQVGTPREVYELPANRFVAEFLGDSNIICGSRRQMSSDLCEVAEPGGLRIRCATGPEPCSSEAIVLIRPEHLRIVSGGPPSDFALRGVVDEVMYVGDLTKYWIRMDDGGSRLLAKAPSQESLRTLRLGARVSVDYNPTDARLMPGSSSDHRART